MTYRINDLCTHYGIECTSANMANYFTVNELLPYSVISRYKIKPIRVEVTNKGKGYRHIYLTDDVINTALANGMEITAPAKEIADKKREAIVLDKMAILEDELSKLQSLIAERNIVLEKLNKQIEISAHKLNQTLNDPLLNEDEILLLAGIRRQKCGVYFLLKDNEIVYVGQSINISERIKTHESSDKDFDRFTYVECERAHLSELEAKYIFKFKPKYNYNVNGRLVMPLNLTLKAPDVENLYR